MKKFLLTLLKRFVIYGLAGFGIGLGAASCTADVAVSTDAVYIDSPIAVDTLPNINFNVYPYDLA